MSGKNINTYLMNSDSFDSFSSTSFHSFSSTGSTEMDSHDLTEVHSFFTVVEAPCNHKRAHLTNRVKCAGAITLPTFKRHAVHDSNRDENRNRKEFNSNMLNDYSVNYEDSSSEMGDSDPGEDASDNFSTAESFTYVDKTEKPPPNHGGEEPDREKRKTDEFFRRKKTKDTHYDNTDLSATRFVIENEKSGRLTVKNLTETSGPPSGKETGDVYVCRLGRVVDDGAGGLSVKVISGSGGKSGYYKDPAVASRHTSDGGGQSAKYLLDGSLVYVCRLVRDSATDVDMSRALDQTTMDHGQSGVCGKVCPTRCKNKVVLLKARRTLDYCRKVKTQFLLRHDSIRTAVQDLRRVDSRRGLSVEDQRWWMRGAAAGNLDKPGKTYFFRDGTVVNPEAIRHNGAR